MVYLKYPLRSGVAQSGHGANDRAPEAHFDLPPLTGFARDHRIQALDLRQGSSPPLLDTGLIDVLQRVAQAAARADHREGRLSTNKTR